MSKLNALRGFETSCFISFKNYKQMAKRPTQKGFF